MKKNIGPTSLISYISFTLIFFIVKSKFGFDGTSWIWIFLIVTGIIQFCNNLYLTNFPEICGKYNITSALSATIVPWIFVFGLSCLCLVLIPGWLRVFSNTFGAGIANMAGLNEIVNKIFVPTTPSVDSAIKETINLLYTNRSKFINEIDMDYQNVQGNITWPTLKSVLDFMSIPEPLDDDRKIYTDLYYILTLKEDAGYFAWFILIGSISILISTNSLLLTSCSSAEFSF
jgi:hypothetical protein